MGSHEATTVFLLGIAISLLGISLLRRGLRKRRVGNTPHCPECEYILIGNDCGTCPECGRPFTPSGILHGEPYRRRGMAAAGAFLFPLGILITTLGFSGVANQINWYRHRPFRWVMQDLDSPLPGAPTRAITELLRRDSTGELSASRQTVLVDRMLKDLSLPPNTITGQEWIELQRRASAHSLSQAQFLVWASQVVGALDSPRFQTSDIALREIKRLTTNNELPPEQAATLVERAIKVQTSSAGGTNFFVKDFLMRYLGDRYLARGLSAEQEQRFFSGCASLSLKVRQRVGLGDSVPYVIEHTGNGPSDWTQKLEFLSTDVDGLQIYAKRGGSSGSFGGGSTGSSIPAQPAGHHTLQLTLGITIGKGDLWATGAKGNLPPESATIFREEQRKFTADFDVMPDLPPLKQLEVPDATTIGKSIRASAFRYDNGAEENPKIQGEIEFTAPPVNLAFHVFARIDGKEYPMGTLAALKAAQGNFGVYCRAVTDKVVPKFDIVLRSSEAVGKGTLDMMEYWKGEIVLKDVPLKLPVRSVP
jgi:hypothetical protein